MGVEDWSTDEALNLELDGADISRRASPGAPANELTRKLMAHVKELEEKIVSDGIAVDGITIENNSGTLTVKDVAIDGDTTDLLTAKIEEIEAAATQAGEDATAAQTAATQAAASAASAASAITSAATAANSAAEQAGIAARAAARAQSGAAMAESAVQAVMAGTNLNWQKSEKAGAVAVCPVPETALEPTVDFLFTEVPPASGDKGPSNPSVIAGVSSVALVRGSSNIASVPRNKTWSFPDGVTFASNSEGAITTTGTPTANRHTQGTDLSTIFTVNVPPGRYTLSAGVDTHKSHIFAHIIKANGSNYFPEVTTDERSTSFYINDGDVLHDVRVQANQGQSYNETVFPCLSLYGAGEDISASETIDLTLGSTYYGGTLDVATGVMTVTHVAVTPDASTVDIASAPAALPLDYADTYGRTITSADGTSLAVGSTGGTVVYKLATPQAVQLDPVSISALSQTDKYTPRLNTIYTDASAVQVGYAKSPIRSEYELTQAIIATEGGE